MTDINISAKGFTQTIKKRTIPFPFSCLGEIVTDFVYGYNPTCLSFPDRWQPIGLAKRQDDTYTPASGGYSTGGCRPNGRHSQRGGRRQGGYGGRGYQGRDQER